MSLESLDMERVGVQHPNPLRTYLTNFLPRTLKSIFTLCEYVYVNSPQIFAGLNKLARYPITNFQYKESNKNAKAKFKNLFEKRLHLPSKLEEAGINKFVYGNSFVSVFFPIKRFLVCEFCGRREAITACQYKFTIKRKTPVFTLTCSSCGKKGTAEVKDVELKHIAGINVINWNPKRISIDDNPITGQQEYYYNVDDNVRRKVKMGNKYILSTLPFEFIKAIARNELFKFGENKLYHMSTETPAGIHSSWGLPPMAGNLGRFMYIATLRKANEAIAAEYIVPFRVLHPAQSSAIGDPTTTISLANWVSQVKYNYKAWRRDPLHLMFSPIPVDVTNIGGNGRTLMVTGEINEAELGMIASMGVPKEFIYGGLTATGSSVTLRMLENQLRQHTTQLNELAQWIADKCAAFLGWKKIYIELEPFKLIDDVAQKSLLLNANSATNNQLLSVTSLAALFDRDLDKERELRYQETVDDARWQFKLQQTMDELQKTMANKAQAITGSQGGAPYNQQEIIAQASQIVAQMAQMDPSSRKSFLHSLQVEDYVMYAVVIQEWERVQTENNAAMRAQMQQQQQQQQQ